MRALTSPAHLSDALKALGFPPESVQTLGPVLVASYPKPEVARPAWEMLKTLGYCTALCSHVIVVTGRVEGNPFFDQKQFQMAFQKDLPPGVAAYQLYRTLITEELKELDNANTAAEHLDALIDLIYVVVGAGIALQHDMQGAWTEVHRTNMAKLGPDGKPIIREGDGKVLKPEGWKPPYLEPFVGITLPEFQPSTTQETIQ